MQLSGKKEPRLTDLRRGEQAVGLVIKGVPVARLRAFLDGAAEAIESGEHFPPLLAARKAHALRRIEVAHPRGVGADAERRACTGQITGARRVRIATDAIAGNRHVRRQVRAETSLVRDDAAEARKLQLGRGPMTGQQVARAGVVIAEFVGELANERHVAHHLCRVRQVFADADARHARRDVRKRAAD